MHREVKLLAQGHPVNKLGRWEVELRCVSDWEVHALSASPHCLVDSCLQPFSATTHMIG